MLLSCLREISPSCSMYVNSAMNVPHRTGFIVFLKFGSIGDQGRNEEETTAGGLLHS